MLTFAVDMNEQKKAQVMLEKGLKHVSELRVDESVTAMSMGSGDMPVFATPAMLALMENAAMLAVAEALPDGCTTVGGQIEASHVRPTKLGDVVKATAEVVGVEGKKIFFNVSVTCNDILIGEGTHLRFIVDRKQFLERLA